MTFDSDSGQDPGSRPPGGSRVVVLCGNPRGGSRTLDVARRLGDAVTGYLALGPATEVDIADFAAELFGPRTGALDEALATVQTPRVLIVATPVYKGALTGLLKSFLDLLPAGSLEGVTAVPLCVAASPAHLEAADASLRPVLDELGADTPTAAFTVQESQLAALPGLVADWLTGNGPRLVPAADLAEVTR